MMLDGGLATELEARGHNLDDPLWSARLLHDAPGAIQQLHYDYLAAGADCITAATYQASFAGFVARGHSDEEAVQLLLRGVELALAARDEFWSDPRNRRDRQRPLVAASIGPYGAFLADGSEYDGRYDIDDDALYTFHQRRWHTLADSGADLLACETIPSALEAHVLLRLLRETPGCAAWFSFSCRNGTALHDGTRFTQVIDACDGEVGVAAVGINCTAPHYVTRLMSAARAHTTKPIVVYPNSGEHYDATSKTWSPGRERIKLGEAAAEWVGLGASAIGGCCRVGPDQIAAMRERILA